MRWERSSLLCRRERPESRTVRIQGGFGHAGSQRWSVMTHFLVLIALMSCQPSPVGPSQNITSDAPEVTSDWSQWEGMIEVNLESFESTEQLRADRSVFPTENLHLDQVFLDKEVAFSAAGLTRSMRYDWVNQGTKSVSIGRGIPLPEAVDEVWTEVAVRWSRNYTPCNPAEPPCAHKLLFLQVTPDGNERWDVVVGGAGEGGPKVHFTMSGPYGHLEGSETDRSWSVVRALRSLDSPAFELTPANPYFDEQWHVIRLHAKHSTSEDTYDGRMRFWIDGKLLYDSDQIRDGYGGPGFSTNAGTKIRAILLGRNKDKGLDQGTESVWIGRVRAWKEDPGW